MTAFSRNSKPNIVLIFQPIFIFVFSVIYVRMRTMFCYSFTRHIIFSGVGEAIRSFFKVCGSFVFDNFRAATVHIH